MTLPEFLALPSDKQDALVAEKVIGFELQPFSGELRIHGFRGGPKPIPNYSTDITAAWIVEEEIERRNLYYEYVTALLKVLKISETDGWPPIDVFFDIAHASPLDRCTAALRAVGVVK